MTNAIPCPACKETVASDSKHCPQCGVPMSLKKAVELDDLDGRATLVDPGVEEPRSRELEPGTVFDRRFVIDRAIGRGGMGVVYRAKDNVTGDAVALKLIHPQLLAKPAIAERFLREGKLTRSLRHPNIVSVFDVNVASGVHYLSMECLEGTSLREWLVKARQQRRVAPLPTAIAIAREIAAGVAAAHAAGVVHRDLKPENVILLRDPNGSEPFGTGAVKVLDFGIARAFGTTEQLTMAGGTLGTPVYMAPEQETGADSVGAEADVYSLAAIFYEILLGVPPRGRFELPSKIRPELPRALDEICEKALSAHPARRYPDAAAWSKALDGLGGSKPIDSDSLNRLGDLGKDVIERWKQGNDPQAFPKSFGHWMLMNAIPCFAFVPWFMLWRRTKIGKHLGYAMLYLLPMLSAGTFSEEAGGGEPTPSYDQWGNVYYGSSDEDSAAEEERLGAVIVIVGLWIVAILHANKNKELIEGLRSGR